LLGLALATAFGPELQFFGGGVGSGAHARGSRARGRGRGRGAHGRSLDLSVSGLRLATGKFVVMR
jgi:hypothetical protein